VEFVGKSEEMPIRSEIDTKSNIIIIIGGFMAFSEGKGGSGKYEIYVDYSNIGPLAAGRAAVIDACQRAPDLHGVALCGRRGAH